MMGALCWNAASSQAASSMSESDTQYQIKQLVIESCHGFPSFYLLVDWNNEGSSGIIYFELVSNRHDLLQLLPTSIPQLLKALLLYLTDPSCCETHSWSNLQEPPLSFASGVQSKAAWLRTVLAWPKLTSSQEWVILSLCTHIREAKGYLAGVYALLKT